MVRYANVVGQKDRVRALTGLNPVEFADLVPAFAHAFEAAMEHRTIEGYDRVNRRYSTYKNSPLPTIEDKLLFILVHLKQNCTQEVQGQLFRMSQPHANKWIHLLHPILNAALRDLGACPTRIAILAKDQEPPTNDQEPPTKDQEPPTKDQETLMNNQETIVHTQEHDMDAASAVTSPLFFMMGQNGPSIDRLTRTSRPGITVGRSAATRSRTSSCVMKNALFAS